MIDKLPIVKIEETVGELAIYWWKSKEGYFPKGYYRFILKKGDEKFEKIVWDMNYYKNDYDAYGILVEFEIVNSIPLFDGYKTFPYTSYKIVED